jgi:regulatory protein
MKGLFYTKNMKITGITAQVRDKDRVNVMVDGKYRFSLDILQLGDLGIKVGREYSDAEMAALEEESQFGKIYTRALEYSLTRPRSQKEIRDYLYRKTRDTRTKTGDIKKGASKQLTERVFERLQEKGYIDDEKFTRFWVENRNQIKGISRRKLIAELRAKGIENVTIEAALTASDRSDNDELQKIITKKRNRYPDDQKLMAYLARQGFSYDDIRQALETPVEF